MSSILSIRSIDSTLLAAAKAAAALQGVTLREWVISAMEDRVIHTKNAHIASEPRPPGRWHTAHTPIVERAVQAGVDRGHDTKNCRIYGCLMCKELKA